MSKTGPILELQQATKRFGALVAVDALSLRVEPGEIHALVGENGAGKSTALKLLAGHLAPDGGAVHIAGVPLRPHTARQAMKHGVGMVHQHFMLVDAFSALDNIMLGAERTKRFGVLDRAGAQRHAERVAERAGLTMDLTRRTSSLSVGERQRLEILRVLVRGARALLLDEPTAVLSPPEVTDLYRMLRTLAKEGASILLVTHRLDEVMQHCDRATVMRRGKHVAEQQLESSTTATLRASLTRAIMGGTVATSVARPPPCEEEQALSLVAEVADDGGHGKALDVTLEVQRGEILGVAGVEGNGQGPLARCLAGLQALSGGHIQVAGKRVLTAGKRHSIGQRVARVRAAGLVVVHADRHRSEILDDASVADNLVLGDLGTVDEGVAVSRRLGRFQVYPAEPSRLGRELSGGNQQKLVMARALDRPMTVLVAAQPTRGVDVGTAQVIQRAITAAASNGAGVLVISADLHELRSLCHRIVVLRKGTFVAEFPPTASDEDIGRAMLGTEAA